MKYQLTPWNCGPAAVQNAFRALGRKFGQAKIAEICGTSPEDGTDEEGIMRAILHYQAFPAVIEASNDLAAGARLSYHIYWGEPVIICVDKWQHWVTVVGQLGTGKDERFVVIDSARFGYNLAENGVKIITRQNLLKRWRVGRRVAGKHQPYYGIAVVV